MQLIHSHRPYQIQIHNNSMSLHHLQLTWDYHLHQAIYQLLTEIFIYLQLNTFTSGKN